MFEERRLRVDNSALGPFSEQFALASLSNNYRWGWCSHQGAMLDVLRWLACCAGRAAATSHPPTHPPTHTTHPPPPLYPHAGDR